MGLTVHDDEPASAKPGRPAKRAGEPAAFSQTLMQAAACVEFAEWDIGERHRRVGVRAPKGADGMRLARILSGDDASKPAVFNQAMLAYCISEIDGNPVSRPASELQIEVILDRLGFEGIAAASEAFGRLGSGEVAAEAKK